MLFKPFKEQQKNISQNNSIGIGLTSSKEICTELNGKLELVFSTKGLTVFSFQVPVDVEEQDIEPQGAEVKYKRTDINELKKQSLLY